MSSMYFFACLAVVRTHQMTGWLHIYVCVCVCVLALMFAVDCRVKRNSFIWCLVAFESCSVDCGATGGEVALQAERKRVHWNFSST